MKIGIITTLSHNIGDDFVRVGIINLINALTLGRQVDYVLVNKHEPLTVYPPNHPLNWMGKFAENLPRGRRRFERYAESLLHGLGGSRFHDCNIIIQSGAPVIFDGCARAEWSVPIWDHIAGALSSKVPVMNIAAGTCYAWESQPDSVPKSDDAEFLQRISSFCRLTTVRERLAHSLMNKLGVETKLLPCTAFLSGINTINSSTDSSPIYINYMEGGGHYSFGQGISGKTWLETLKDLIARVRKRHDVRVICHTKREYQVARQEFSDIQAILPASVEEYYQHIAQAKCGIYNRLHASVALGGIGVPSVAIGTDTRMLMLDEIKTPYRYIAEANAEELENTVENLLAERASEKERLLALRAQTWAAYSELFKATLSLG